MPEPARPIPVKLDVETLAALDALVAAGRQPTRSSAIRAGIELLLDAEHRRALDLGLGSEGVGEAVEARRDASRPRARRSAVGGRAAVATAAVAERMPAPALVPPPAPEPAEAEDDVVDEGSVVDLRPAAAARTPPRPSGPRPGLSVDW